MLPNTVHLVAVAGCNDARIQSEATVYLPPYPYALGSSGQIVSQGKLEVLGVDSLADADGGLTPEEKKPGHVVSNSAEADAVVLNPQAHIEGDVRAVGFVQRNGAEILGDEKTGQQPADLPEIRIEDYDPRRFTDAYNLELSIGDAVGQSGPMEVSSQRIRVNADGGVVNLNNGVVLDDGMLFVEGDLHVRGGVKGSGAIIATGKITIEGPSSIEGEMTALVSGKGVNIDGRGLGISSFRGLVATLGDFEADSTSVLGAYLAVGKDPVTQLGTSKMTLRDVQAIHAPEATSVDIVAHVELKKMLDVGKGAVDANGSQIGLLVNGAFYTFTGAPKRSDESQAAYETRRDAEIQATYDALKGPTDGSPYAMAAGEVVVRDAAGQSIDPPASLRRSYENSLSSWNIYKQSVPRGDVEVIPIFSIDLNRFTSGSSRIKILTYK